MKKVLTAVFTALLACSLMACVTLATQIIIPGQENTGAQQAPVIASQQQQPAQSIPADSAAASQQPAQQDAAVPAQNEAGAQAAPARVFQTEDGVFSMNIPEGAATWAAVQDPETWFTVSDGTDKISVLHLANGDPVPAAQIAPEKPAEIFQIFYSTGNEIFIVTGYAADAQRMPAIRDAVCSFKVLKYDTLEKKEVPKAPQVREVNEIQYSVQPDGVNVRSEPNTTSSVIGGIVYGDQVNVTGYVVENGADTGWLQISFNGKNGYVHGSNFSKTQPPARTGNSFDLFAPEGGGVVVRVYELADGRCIDDSGNYYTKASDTEYFNENDEKWVLPEYFDDNPVGQIFTDFYQDMVNEYTGESVTVRLLTDGRYINEDTQIIYNMEGGGGPHMYGEDGSVLVVPEEY